MFASWGTAFVDAGINVVAVQYPGRETRLDEAPLANADQMVQALLKAWPDISAGAPCAFFGHSMGALLAYEFAAVLHNANASNRPHHLFLSGSNPPDIPANTPDVHSLSDRELIQYIAQSYKNIPKEVLSNSEAVALFAPILRADLLLVKSLRASSRALINASLHILCGADDPWTSSYALHGWQRYTSREIELHEFVGDHFYISTAKNEVLSLISRVLRRGEC